MPLCSRVVFPLVAALNTIIIFYNVTTSTITNSFTAMLSLSNLQNMLYLPILVLHCLIRWSMRERINKKFPHLKLIVTVYSLLMASSINYLLLLVFGIHPNPGPISNNMKRLTFGVWNIDSLLSSKFSKIPLIEGLQNMLNFDLFGVCETYLNDEHTFEDIHIKGFSDKPFRSDSKSSNEHKKGGVALYYKSDLPIRERKELNALDECIVSEIKLKMKRYSLYLYTVAPVRTQR